MSKKDLQDLQDIIEIHNLGFVYDESTCGGKFVKVDPKQVAAYIYWCGYRKIPKSKEEK